MRRTVDAVFGKFVEAEGPIDDEQAQFMKRGLRCAYALILVERDVLDFVVVEHERAFNPLFEMVVQRKEEFLE